MKKSVKELALRKIIRTEIQAMMGESTAEYEKTLLKIAKDRQLKMLSTKDKETLIKIVKLLRKEK